MNCCDYSCHQGRDCPGRRQAQTLTSAAMATAPKHTSTPAEDELENDLGTATLQLLVTYGCIAVVSFALGLVVGQL